MEKSVALGPEIVADEKVTGRVPIFLKVRPCGPLDWPVCVELKVKLEGFQASEGELLFCWEAVAVNKAGEMVRLVEKGTLMGLGWLGTPVIGSTS